ncbi:hypothetical protein HPP92_017761 [Vanilla planifolia]|uniref:N-acetyltransferase domain-containing protein n=1 Tax=Vanilla planifolia TaxID=51239 RepID=A0A835UNT0_VANPL|nr:hypothetical protein HPP92_017761 [Vanilla planifolia]
MWKGWRRWRGCARWVPAESCLFTHLLGDPLSRVRHSPSFLMLVAESSGEIVGVVRGCVKTATCGRKPSRSSSGAKNCTPVYTKLAYLLGLRVSPSHRRRGIGLNLVQRMEDWFRAKGAEYAYMATDPTNSASLCLFTHRCRYTQFRTPSILVQPVFAHRLPLGRRADLFSLPPSDAEALYRRRFSTIEFFPRDIDAVLRNPLNLATILAVPRGWNWPGSVDRFLTEPPESWAVLSVWNCKDVFRLEVRGAGRVRQGLARLSRAVDRAFPFMRLPSVPDIFRPFGLYLLYGMGGDGPQAAEMVRMLCRHAHNMARESRECRVVATEVAPEDPSDEAYPTGVDCLAPRICGA